MIKIFHTGDLHLDAAFSRLDREERYLARCHQREIFKKMMKYVSDESFDMVLISGDLFDSGNISPETEECVVSAFASLSCPVIISPGNHDSLSDVPFYSKKLPENVYIFNTEDMQVFTFDELRVQVCGYAFVSDCYEKDPLKGFSLPEFDGVSVLCAHTELNVPASRYAPISDADIERIGFSYAALGHIHKPTEPIVRGKTVISYCGFPEGRAFDETGEGGAMTVVISDSGVSVKKKIFGEKKYYVEHIDVGYVSDDKELTKKIEEYISERGYGKDTALRLFVRGEAEISFVPDLKGTEKNLSEKLLQLQLYFELLPRIDRAALEGDRTLKGQVYRKLRDELDSEDEEVSRLAYDALKAAIWAIDGREMEGLI